MPEFFKEHMLPCYFKQLIGFDCPFCGSQRALALLFEGDILGSLTMYPALLPLLLTGFFFISRLLSFTLITKAGLSRLFYATLAIIFISYCLKISNIVL